MAQERIISVMAKGSIAPDQFNHFDYVDALQQLSELELLNHPRKRKLVEEFASKCLQKLEEEENSVQNREKVDNFLSRMKVCQRMRQQRLQALKFIEEKYDKKNGQLKYYPKINKRMVCQRTRNWKDIDDLDRVPRQESIHLPNESRVDNHSVFSFKNK